MLKLVLNNYISFILTCAIVFFKFQLNLIEGINNDVAVSAIVSGGHIFVQHPLHPTHPSLALLQKNMYDSYITGEAPLLPSIELNTVCVMQVNAVWYRVQIIDNDAEDAERCYIKFLDFGGYMNVHFKELRQIRADFMSVPFQATECVLSNVEPIGKLFALPIAILQFNIYFYFFRQLLDARSCRCFKQFNQRHCTAGTNSWLQFLQNTRNLFVCLCRSQCEYSALWQCRQRAHANKIELINKILKCKIIK